jgi:hypothetical protein
MSRREGQNSPHPDGGHGKPPEFSIPERVGRNNFHPAGRELTFRGKEDPQC